MKTIITLIFAVVTTISVTAQTNNTEIDSVTYTLGEVVVKANPRITSLKGDALLTRVAGTQLEHAGTANDVLPQIPMILGSDGNFEVFGKGNPAIYVNGRLLQDTSDLAQISSANIKNVEVITNPGAKYSASAKAVINITLKAPRGDGLSGLIRAQGSLQKYFRNSDQFNLKYRTGGLEVFGNFSYSSGKKEDAATNDMLTRSSVIWNQIMEQYGKIKLHDFYGKIGFSYMFNPHQSIGAYYANGSSKANAHYSAISRILSNNILYDELSVDIHKKSHTIPNHRMNLYYTGIAGRLGIDFNMDFMWQKKASDLLNDELSGNFEDAQISSGTTNHSRLVAEKLIFSYPVWKGKIELGEEYTSSRFTTDYITDASSLTSAISQVDENNIAGFIQLAQRFGMWHVGAGLRYEHVAFKYLENEQRRDDMSRSYNNLFPSLSVSTMLQRVQMSLSYSYKTQRPTYSALDGTINYINRFTFEGGNPYLKPEKIHNIQFAGVWSHFFGQLSYSYKKDPILNTTLPYGEDGEIKLITKENFSKIQQLEAFAGGQFQLGIWQPKINAGLITQWLTIDYNGERKNLNNPIGLIQFQNAIHLPYDIWLNIDLQWMSAGNGENAKITSTSYLNAKLYKAFFNNRFSVTLEANDIFNKDIRDFTLYNKDVTIFKSNHITNRTFHLTLQYTFNITRDRYAGKGAGHNELNRF
ncbi:MAG: TonB-dependent receptor [Muribaculaceae bacterium]|nr:TonB-dependent receptor [Muribaculaceae bacterium]